MQDRLSGQAAHAPSGPLAGCRIVEFGTVGPVPYAAMLLADMGATVIRIDRVGAVDLGIGRDWRFETTRRHRRSIRLDLKSPAAVAIAADLIAGSDALVEGFRPGVMERLGLGPEVFADRNPRLVYGRMTGWGQDGPLAPKAGHDLNYLALSGALHSIGHRGQPPAIPLNFVADFGGGSLFLALGVVAALLEAAKSGRGQVVDCAMIDGVSSLMTSLYGIMAAGQWNDQRGTNATDGGSPWYTTYETLDGRHVAVAAVEGRFYAELLTLLDLADQALPGQHDRAGWPVLRARFAAAFRTRTRDAWTQAAEALDACVTPVLTPAEATADPHLRARGAHVDVAGIVHPAPAPRFGRTPAAPPALPVQPGADTDMLLAELGLAPARIADLRREGAVA
ncbi:CaiB/BaiF CoA transferase family protein [Sphingomonas sp.]|uniref:CaiB/BaiF CoA transferase family protein n=1 Tax=Sphingomonas sp. TaxID=28214 RepID=UPI002DD6A2C5|nr:CaiB/BaiF CoA-transferase family protein [Sphingomonas sp.]